MRKTGKWYRLDQLKYVAELGTEGIVEAMKELCGALGSGTNSRKSISAKSSQASSQSLKGVIDLMSDDEDHIILPGAETSTPSVSSQRHAPPIPASSSGSGLLDHYAEDESRASLSELLKCLNVDELKSLAKTLKLSNTLTTVRVLTLWSTSSSHSAFISVRLSSTDFWNARLHKLLSEVLLLQQPRSQGKRQETQNPSI